MSVVVVFCIIPAALLKCPLFCSVVLRCSVVNVLALLPHEKTVDDNVRCVHIRTLEEPFVRLVALVLYLHGLSTVSKRDGVL